MKTYSELIEASTGQRKAEKSVSTIIKAMDTIQRQIDIANKLSYEELEHYWITDTKKKNISPNEFKKVFQKFRASYPNLKER